MFGSRRKTDREALLAERRRAEAASDVHFVENCIAKMEHVLAGAGRETFRESENAKMVALTGTDAGLRPIHGFTWIGLDDVKLWGLGSGTPFRLVMQWDFDRCTDIIVSAEGPVTVRFVTDDEPESLVGLSGSDKLAWLVYICWTAHSVGVPAALEIMYDELRTLSNEVERNQP